MKKTIAVSCAIGAITIAASLGTQSAQAQTTAKPASDSLDGRPSKTILSRFIQFEPGEPHPPVDPAGFKKQLAS